MIVSDVNMLGNNGIDFIEKLIEKGCKQGHFALMSGAFTDNDRARAAHLGCAVFEKPVDMEALTAWVESVEKSIPPERVLFDWTGVE
jgi:DNA-binding response OmpR family regulator